jgi:predicted amidophosphoribosyltransferase
VRSNAGQREHRATPTVDELAAPYASFMLAPRPDPGVCVRCFNFTDGYDQCFACAKHEDALSAVAPISYSVGGEQLHHALASYKRLDGPLAERLTVGIAAVLWRFLDAHEACVARASGTDSFPIVTTIPSSSWHGVRHPMGHVVGQLVGPTRVRHRPLLARTNEEVASRAFSPEKFRVLSALRGEPVLLIDDTWTTGANVQCAAAALRDAGAGPVAAVVIGRHVNRDWHQNDRRLRALERFDWATCVVCAGAVRSSSEGSSRVGS